MQIYSKKDIDIRVGRIQAKLVQLEKFAQQQNWPQACSTIRAIEDECRHTSRVAGALSLNQHLQLPQSRMSRANTGATS